MAQGNFFAIGVDEFRHACELGLRPAVALLVMARGTQKDHATTSWSAQSIFDYTGMAWRRGKEAIEKLSEAGIITVLKEGKKPRYKLSRPKETEDFLWLPNELIDGAGSETPPICKLRERGDLLLLQRFVELYAAHDLTSDAGLSRSLVRGNYLREKVCETGKFIVYSFRRELPSANAIGILADCNGQENDDGDKGAWIVLSPLIDMGLIQEFTYMVESADKESELLYPLNERTKAATSELIDHLDSTGGSGFAAKLEKAFPLVGIALEHLANATMVGVYRLVYRPKTAKTTVWYATEMGQTDRFVEGVGKLCGRNVDINGLQGCSMVVNDYQ